MRKATWAYLGPQQQLLDSAISAATSTGDADDPGVVIERRGRRCGHHFETMTRVIPRRTSSGGYVVNVALVQDNAVPPNRRRLPASPTRGTRRVREVSLSKSQSDIGNISTETVTVGVGGTISDNNVIKVADLSIREMVADGATCAWLPKISRRWPDRSRGPQQAGPRERLEQDRVRRDVHDPEAHRPKVWDRRRTASGWRRPTSRSNADGRGDGNTGELRTRPLQRGLAGRSGAAASWPDVRVLHAACWTGTEASTRRSR